MVDYAVMWIHQRTGENTAISAPLWAYVIGLMALMGLAVKVADQVWPVLVVAAVGYVGYLAIRRYGEKSATAERLAKRFRERD